MWPLDQKPRVILSHWASVYNIKALYNGFKNAVYFTQNLRISGEAIYFSRLILRLSKRFIYLSGIATHKSVENASERLKMALNRMFWPIITTFTIEISACEEISSWTRVRLPPGPQIVRTFSKCTTPRAVHLCNTRLTKPWANAECKDTRIYGPDWI